MLKVTVKTTPPAPGVEPKLEVIAWLGKRGLHYTFATSACGGLMRPEVEDLYDYEASDSALSTSVEDDVALKAVAEHHIRAEQPHWDKHCHIGLYQMISAYGDPSTCQQYLAWRKQTVSVALANQALFMQDACNASGVAHSIADMASAVLSLGGGTDKLREHPAMILAVSKLGSMFGLFMDLGRFGEADRACRQVLEDAGLKPPE